MPDGDRKEWRPRFDFSRSKVAYSYFKGRNLVDTIVGPVGSGKTYASCVRPFIIGANQAKSPDGIRHTMGAIVRNTMPELKSTTMATWRRMWPEPYCGRIIMASPAKHTIRRGDMQIEILFLALDKPADIKKLLSLELTWAYFNEKREIPRALVNRMTERVGRYRINERPTTWSGIWGDTNSYDTHHYLYKWDRMERPEGFEFYHQPPAVLEVELVGGKWICNEDTYPEHAGREFRQDVIEAAGRFWVINPKAENLDNLQRVRPDVPATSRLSYYGRALAGKRLEEIQCYSQGKYVFVIEGKPCVPEYNDQLSAVRGLEALADRPLIIGIDIGGGTLQPSALIFQTHPRGTYLALGEVCCFDMGVERFGDELIRYLSARFPRHMERRNDRELGIAAVWGDPAGNTRDEIFETTAFQHLRAEHGLPVYAAPTQDPVTRINALKNPCNRLIGGRPGLLVSFEHCPMFRQGMMGGYHFRKLQVAGEERYTEKPNKNEYSHVCEAGGYGFLGAGEFRLIQGRDPNASTGWGSSGQVTANTDFAF